MKDGIAAKMGTYVTLMRNESEYAKLFKIRAEGFIPSAQVMLVQ